jgi:autotransporter-associated beta strand protein
MRSIDSSAGNLARRMRALLAGTAISAAATLPAVAADATWLLSPGTGDFNTAANWTPAAVPTGIATFGVSNTTALSFSADTTVGAWRFGAGASNYTFTNGHTLNFNGVAFQVLGGGATITTTNGGLTKFTGAANGGNGGIRFVTQAGGAVDISGSTAGGFVTGSIEGAGNYIMGDKLFSVGNNNASTVVDGVISGSILSTFVKDGSGTLTLSGANTYTGSTDIIGGTLIVNGSIANSNQTFVESGAKLSGTGTVGEILVFASGTFAPGSGVPGSHMNVTGNLGFDSGATYLVQVNPASASSAAVSGSAT